MGCVFGNPIEVKLHTYNCLQGKCRSQPRLGGQWILILAVLQPVLLISLRGLLDWFLLCCLNMIAWKSVQILRIGFFTMSYLRKCFYLVSLSNRSSCRSKMSKNIIWNLLKMYYKCLRLSAHLLSSVSPPMRTSFVLMSVQLATSISSSASDLCPSGLVAPDLACTTTFAENKCIIKQVGLTLGWSSEKKLPIVTLRWPNVTLMWTTVALRREVTYS